MKVVYIPTKMACTIRSNFPVGSASIVVDFADGSNCITNESRLAPDASPRSLCSKREELCIYDGIGCHGPKVIWVCLWEDTAASLHAMIYENTFLSATLRFGRHGTGLTISPHGTLYDAGVRHRADLHIGVPHLGLLGGGDQDDVMAGDLVGGFGNPFENRGTTSTYQPTGLLPGDVTGNSVFDRESDDDLDDEYDGGDEYGKKKLKKKTSNVWQPIVCLTNTGRGISICDTPGGLRPATQLRINANYEADISRNFEALRTIDGTELSLSEYFDKALPGFEEANEEKQGEMLATTLQVDNMTIVLGFDESGFSDVGDTMCIHERVALLLKNVTGKCSVITAALQLKQRQKTALKLFGGDRTYANEVTHVVIWTGGPTKRQLVASSNAPNFRQRLRVIIRTMLRGTRNAHFIRDDREVTQRFADKPVAIDHVRLSKAILAAANCDENVTGAAKSTWDTAHGISSPGYHTEAARVFFTLMEFGQQQPWSEFQKLILPMASNNPIRNRHGRPRQHIDLTFHIPNVDNSFVVFRQARCKPGSKHKFKTKRSTKRKKGAQTILPPRFSNRGHVFCSFLDRGGWGTYSKEGGKSLRLRKVQKFIAYGTVKHFLKVTHSMYTDQPPKTMKQARSLLNKVAAFSKALCGKGEHGPAQQERIKDGLGARIELSTAGTLRAGEFVNLKTRVCRKLAKWFSQDMDVKLIPFDTVAHALVEAVKTAEAYASIPASGLSYPKPEVMQALCVALALTGYSGDFPFQAATVGFKPTSPGAGLDLSVLGWDTEPFLNAWGSDKSTHGLRSHRLRHLQAMAECMSLSGRYITERTCGFSWKDAFSRNFGSMLNWQRVTGQYRTVESLYEAIYNQFGEGWVRVCYHQCIDGGCILDGKYWNPRHGDHHSKLPRTQYLPTEEDCNTGASYLAPNWVIDPNPFLPLLADISSSKSAGTKKCGARTLRGGRCQRASTPGFLRCFAHRPNDTHADATCSGAKLVDATFSLARASGPECLAKTFQLMSETGAEQQLVRQGKELLSTTRDILDSSGQESVGWFLRETMIPSDIQGAISQTFFTCVDDTDRVQREIHSIFAVDSKETTTSKRCVCDTTLCSRYCLYGGPLPTTSTSYTTIGVPLSSSKDGGRVDVSRILTPSDITIDRPATVDHAKATGAVRTSFQLEMCEHTIQEFNSNCETWTTEIQSRGTTSRSEVGVLETVSALGSFAPEAMASAVVAVRNRTATVATQITVAGDYVLIIGGDGHSDELASTRGELAVCESVKDRNGISYHLIGAAVYEGTQEVLNSGTSAGHYSFLCRTNRAGVHCYTYLDNCRRCPEQFETIILFTQWMSQQSVKAQVLLFRRAGTWERQRTGLPIPRSQLGYYDNNCWLAVSVLLLFMIPTYRKMVSSCTSAGLGTNDKESRNSTQVQPSCKQGSSSSARSKELRPHMSTGALHTSDRRKSDTPPPGATNNASNAKEIVRFHFENVQYHYREAGTSEAISGLTHTMIARGTLTVNDGAVQFEPASGKSWSVLAEWRLDLADTEYIHFKDDTDEVAFTFPSELDCENAYAAIARNAAKLVPGFLVEHGQTKQQSSPSSASVSGDSLMYPVTPMEGISESVSANITEPTIGGRQELQRSINLEAISSASSHLHTMDGSRNLFDLLTKSQAPAAVGKHKHGGMPSAKAQPVLESGGTFESSGDVMLIDSDPTRLAPPKRSIRIHQLQNLYITPLGIAAFLRSFPRNEESPTHENRTLRPCNVPDGSGNTMKGVVAKRNLIENELICEYPGTVGKVQDVRDLEHARQKHGCNKTGDGYTVETLVDGHGHKFAIDGTPDECDTFACAGAKPKRIPAGRYGNLLNHADMADPSCNVKPVAYGTRLLLHARTNVTSGDELRWDYDELKQMDSPPDWMRPWAQSTPLSTITRTATTKHKTCTPATPTFDSKKKCSLRSAEKTPADACTRDALTVAPKQLTYSDMAKEILDQTPKPCARKKQFTKLPKGASFLDVLRYITANESKQQAPLQGKRKRETAYQGLQSHREKIAKTTTHAIDDRQETNTM